MHGNDEVVLCPPVQVTLSLFSLPFSLMPCKICVQLYSLGVRSQGCYFRHLLLRILPNYGHLIYSSQRHCFACCCGKGMSSELVARALPDPVHLLLRVTSL